MTWVDFNTETRLYLTIHNRRQGIQSLIDTLIKSAAIDLQTTVESLQVFHKDTLSSNDVTEDGFATYGDLPAGQIRAARLVSYDPDTTDINEDKYLFLEQVSHKNWLEWASGFAEDGKGLIFIDAARRQFAFTPQLGTDAKLILEWEGVKMEFDDADETPFDARCALAASNYVLAHLTRTIDNDPAGAVAYEKGYARTKRTIYSDALVRQRVKVESRPTRFHNCTPATTTATVTPVDGDGIDTFAGVAIETFAGDALVLF